MLLISDVDGTLTGDEEGLEHFKRHWLEEQVPRGSILCYNTARSINELVSLIRLKEWPELLQPDVLITGEGTEIRFFDSGGTPQLSQQWDRHVREHWNLELVAFAMDPFDHGSIASLNDGEPLRRTITTSHENRDKAAAAIRASVGKHVEVIAMDSWIPGVAMITALPASAGKGNAAVAVRNICGFSSSQTMWAGDTKGDASLLQTDIRGVVVGNASEEFLTIAADHPGRALLARGRAAIGVLEGMQEYGMME